MRNHELIAEHLKPIKCLIYGHSYEILDYVPDFDHEYVLNNRTLQIQNYTVINDSD